MTNPGEDKSLVKILLVSEENKDKTLCVNLDPNTAQKVINGDTQIAQKLWKQVSEAQAAQCTQEQEQNELIVEQSDLSTDASVDINTSNIENAGNTPTDELIWTRAATKELIRLVKTHDHHFNNAKMSRKAIWSIIAEEIKPFINVTLRQTENKWKNLKRRLKTHESHAAERGTIPKPWEFYNDMLHWSNNVDQVQVECDVLPDMANNTSSPVTTGIELHESSPSIASDVIIASSEDTPTEELMWSSAPTLELIKLRVKYDEEFRNPRKIKKKIWESISEEMKHYFNNLQISSVKMENKWKNLKRHFRTVEMRSGGRPKTMWKFYNDMKNALIHCSEFPTPADVSIESFTISCDGQTSESNAPQTGVYLLPDVKPADEAENHRTSSSPQSPPPSKKRKCDTNLSDVVNILNEIKENEKSSYQKMLEESIRHRELMEKMHHDKMNVLESLISVLNK